MSDQNIRCPAQACTGWACEADDGEQSFLGWGKCGNVWFSRDDLDNDISAVIEKHSYRAASYEKIDGHWGPAIRDNEPADFAELVEKEWDD